MSNKMAFIYAWKYRLPSSGSSTSKYRCSSRRSRLQEDILTVETEYLVEGLDYPNDHRMPHPGLQFDLTQSSEWTPFCVDFFSRTTPCKIEFAGRCDFIRYISSGKTGLWADPAKSLFIRVVLFCFWNLLRISPKSFGPFWPDFFCIHFGFKNTHKYK